MTAPTSEEEEVTFAQFIMSLNEEFDERVQTRHALGAQMHQPGEFLITNTVEKALDQLADFANYARYTFIQMRLLQESLAVSTSALPPTPKATTGFTSAKDFTAVRTDG